MRRRYDFVTDRWDYFSPPPILSNNDKAILLQGVELINMWFDNEDAQQSPVK